MKFITTAALAAASIALVGCGETIPESIPYNSQVAIKDWARVGDALVEEGRYLDAYQAYISRCNDASGSHSARMAGCEAARDFRRWAEPRGIDTSGW